MDDKLWEIINEQYSFLENATNASSKLNHINTIIELKGRLTSNNINLYSDIRKFLVFYIDAHEEQNLNYYKIRSNKIEERLIKLTLEEQISLLKFFIRLLKSKGFDDELKLFNQRLKWLIIVSDFKAKKILRFFQGLLMLTSYNFWSILITLFLIITLYILTLLPAPYDSWVIYKIEYIELQSNFGLNHILNLLAYLFHLDDNIQITPVNWRGVVFGVLSKMFLITIVANYLVRELINKIKLE